MTQLDRTKFDLRIPLVVAKLGDPSYIGELGKTSRDDLLNLHGLSKVVKWTDGSDQSGSTGSQQEVKGVLLRHDISDTHAVPEALSPQTQKLLQQASATFHPYTLDLKYDYWKSDEILESVLPEELLDEIPTGFTVVGHIAHLNLRDEYLPYKHLIGQVILDKNSPLVRTVVNKLDSIHAVYRTFDMEVIAGDDSDESFEVEQSESGCRFRFNFRDVYWNSRLHTEHARLVDQFQKGQAVCDVFGGVGPFAIPAGKKSVIVLANDLNPNSYKSLVGNIKLNKVTHTVWPYNEDGRSFIRESVTKLLELSETTPYIQLPTKAVRKSRSAPPSCTDTTPSPQSTPELLPVPKAPSHYVMNLPDSALTFLDAFAGLYADSKLRLAAFGTDNPEPAQYPLIHVHCFHKHEPTEPEPTPEQICIDLKDKVNSIMTARLDVADMLFHRVRKVAPTKLMYCVTFRLPKEVAERSS